MLSDNCRFHFDIRSNAGIMAVDGDPVNQSEIHIFSLAIRLFAFSERPLTIIRAAMN